MGTLIHNLPVKCIIACPLQLSCQTGITNKWANKTLLPPYLDIITIPLCGLLLFDHKYIELDISSEKFYALLPSDNNYVPIFICVTDLHANQVLFYFLHANVTPIIIPKVLSILKTFYWIFMCVVCSVKQGKNLLWLKS